MIKKILIANRGEIACRIIRTCRFMGIKTLVIYSEADKNSLHVRESDESVFIGESPADKSYLNYKKIVQVALENKVDAVHPGYGFLSENPNFAMELKKKKIKFIGPSVFSMKSMSLKNDARSMMEKAGVPVLPGFSADSLPYEQIVKKCDNIGFPLIIKASAGGGGKGMHVISKREEIKSKLAGAKREALSSFGNDSILIEKYLENPRHIEVQILADNHNNIYTLSDRDCSIQRRHQKVIEEAPAPNIKPAVRKEMALQAKNVAKNISYSGAGTIEFLFEKDKFYFMEMNTRLQVEHPVTELILDLDLVELQIRVTNNEKIILNDDKLKIKGHSIEARVYAEVPEDDFKPSPGKISQLIFPNKSYLRMDTGYISGDEVSPYYDPMIAKIISHGKDRNDAISKLSDAIANTHLVGIKNNLNFLYKILNVSAFKDKKINTDFINKFWDKLVPNKENMDLLIELSIAAYLKYRKPSKKHTHLDPWNSDRNWRHVENDSEKISIRNDKKVLNYIVKTIDYNNVFISEDNDKKGNIFTYLFDTVNSDLSIIYKNNKIDVYLLLLNNKKIYINVKGFSLTSEIISKYYMDLSAESSVGSMDAPVPGKIAKVFVKKNQTVKKGDILVIIEAMKMEHSIIAPYSGKVIKVEAIEGEQVNEGFTVAQMEVK
jgi:3-methylcrotonyl-CoA carboxylase alpha subunit